MKLIDSILKDVETLQDLIETQKKRILELEKEVEYQELEIDRLNIVIDDMADMEEL